MPHDPLCGSLTNSGSLRPRFPVCRANMRRSQRSLPRPAFTPNQDTANFREHWDFAGPRSFRLKASGRSALGDQDATTARDMGPAAATTHRRGHVHYLKTKCSRDFSCHLGAFVRLAASAREGTESQKPSLSSADGPYVGGTGSSFRRK